MLVNHQCIRVNHLAKFCLGDICYDWGTNDAAVTLTLESFEEGDYFQGYIQADEPGTYEMTYSLSTM